MTDIGRPEYTDEQYQAWLDEMAPFLKLSYSLHYAMDKAALLRHKDSIYGKYRLNDWFSEKIDAYRRYPGEIVNSIFTRLIIQIDEKLKQGQPISDEEWRNSRFFAEKHRSCQPFFVNRQEVQQTDPNSIARILDILDTQNSPTSYADVAKEAEKQLTEATKAQFDNKLEEAMVKFETV